ncbi:MAG TPA: hypothetical protein VNO35_02350 [Steroidobacteraceae bacterium]|nr:hypothetical protein [Steroidobacteraceae bacterium]
MMIAQPVLQRQTGEQTTMHFIAVKHMIGAVPTPVHRDEFPLRVQGIRQAPHQHRQRFHIKVITHFTEHNQIELTPLDVGFQNVSENAESRLSYSTDGTGFIDVGVPFTAKQGRWIGAKVGLFALGTVPVSEYGFADVDWFRIQ